MTKKRTIGLVLLIVGIAVLVVSGAADAIGLGNSPGFGYKQIVGVAAGAIAAIAGAIVIR
jgi:hypothetical protein